MELEKAQEPQKKALTTLPKFPSWPTSKPGPQVTEPPPGMKRMPLRTEQTLELNYDQTTGEPATYALERSEAEPSMLGRIAPDQEKTLRERIRKERPDLPG